MEQARLLLAIGLSFLVLFVWSMFFVEQPPVNETPDAVQTQEAAAPQERAEETVRPKKEPLPAVATGTETRTDGVASPAREVTVQTPFYRVRISTRGAVFTSYILNEYRESVGADAPKKQLIPETIKYGLLRTAFAQQSVTGLENAVFTLDRKESEITVTGEKQSLVFNWVSENGAALKKIFTFDPQSYLIGLEVFVTNNTPRTVRDNLVLSLQSPVAEDKGYSFVGPSALLDGKLKQVKVKKIEDQSIFNGTIKWIGIEDRYFISSVIPEEEVKGRMKLALIDDVVFNQLENPTFELIPGESKAFRFKLFMGPKSMELLDSLGRDMGKALNFGFFNVIAKPCLWFMNRIYSVIPNYGIAIILLTVFTKVLLWPLGNKSYKSMSEMKKLQPLMTEIREKYKGDKQKMNQELMALYRTYKVNPMGGCLPMILQIPVFFALYRMLYQAIELRHAPFFLWINDLSAPDRLFDFGFSIPFMEPPYGIPVLTIVMGATMLLQQKMSPPPGDPTQAKMMMLMPIVFTFIFINFSSGLVLYWLVNNVLSIGQQYYVQKKTL
jgi:YidC/Oxa1 family membrane protein insertase